MAREFGAGVIRSIEGTIAKLNEIREAAKPEIKRTVSTWIETVAKDAKSGLARPRWLLSSRFGSVVREYRNGDKIFAMAGFTFREKDNKRDPGYYGRFHEAGWNVPGHKVTAPDHFIKKAKQKNLPTLQQKIGDIWKRLGE